MLKYMKTHLPFSFSLFNLADSKAGNSIIWVLPKVAVGYFGGNGDDGYGCNNYFDYGKL